MQKGRSTMHRRSPIAAALAVLMAFLLSSCAGAFRQPEVSLEGVELGGLGLTGGTLLVNVRVHNPNSFTLNADQIRYELLLRDSQAQGDSAWKSFAEGTYQEDVSVGGGRTETFRVPVEFSYSSLGGAATSILRTGRFDYRATGMVVARTPFGAREVPFRKSGTLLMNGSSVR